MEVIFMSVENHNGSTSESAPQSHERMPITLLFGHTEEDTAGDRTTNRLWGVVLEELGVVIETATLKTEDKSTVSAYALNLYTGTSLHFTEGVRDAQGKTVIKVHNPPIQVAIGEHLVEGSLDDAERQDIEVVADAYANLALHGLGIRDTSATREDINLAA
jgi:hypothetical protein